MKGLLHILAAVAVGYGVLLVVMYFYQPRLLFLPNFAGRELTATPASIGLDYEDVMLRTADGVAIHGWFIDHAEDALALIFFHGNAGNISHRLGSLQMFTELGLKVLMIDYRGYGRSEGRPSEAGTRLDALAAWRHLVEDRGIEAGKIVLFGRSLGGSVAVQLARERPPAALILESTFTSVPDLGAELYPWLPVRLLSTIEYDSLSAVREFMFPKLVIHSREDDIVPFHHGLRLFEAAAEPKAFLEISGPHNGGYLYDRDHYLEGLGRFLDTVRD